MASAPKHSATTGPQIGLAGFDCCLEFADTLCEDELGHYGDLLDWARAMHLVSDDETRQLRETAAADPTEARRSFAAAILIRGVIYRVFAAVATNRRPKAGDIAALNESLSRIMSRLRVVAQGTSFTWLWASPTSALDRIVWPIVRSAADLLTSPSLSRVRLCAAPDCGWLFIDRSPAGSRRWCSMKTCGNRNKARRHYHRRKTSRC